MKKVLLLLLALAMIPNLSAQTIRLPQEAKGTNYHEYSLDNSGFWCAIEGTVSSSVVTDHKNAQRGMASYVCGFRFNEYLRIGLGVGANYYFNGNENVRGNESAFTVPVYFDVRGQMLSQYTREIVPYWSLDIGANFGDGFFVSPTIGMRIGQRRSAFLLGINYAVGEIKALPKYPSTIHFVGLKLGYEF